IVPRRWRLVRLFFHATWSPWRAVGRWRRSGRRREEFLGLYGPMSMVVLLGAWASGLVVGFGLLQGALQRGQPFAPGLLDHIYYSGVTFFTLGYGDITPRTPLTKALAVVEAGMGFGFIAVVIGYLPVLYQLYARREAHVVMLDARAGSPPSAVMLLVRHAEGQSFAALEQLLRDWEYWSAELSESHNSYPMLSYYRSQHGDLSWLAALTTIMDACSLILVGLKETRTFQARMTFSMARLAVVEMSRAVHVAPVDLDEDRLPPADFARLQESLTAAGLPLNEPVGARERLAAFQATYEPFLNGLSRHLHLPLPGWLPQEGKLDNWQAGPRGRAAKDLVESSPPSPH
ncbi:MAG TPA: potassium channel family protein, partial [Isosphaeraceae bacterium]